MKYNSVSSFFWNHIKPYKWFYALMLLAPITSAFYPLMYNYAIKLFLDAMTQDSTLPYHSIIVPILLFLSAQTFNDWVWRMSNVAEWKSEPYVRQSILVKSYDYVQHHSYTFFQNNFTGAISSKVKGLLDGYDKFWAEMHHGLMISILKSIVGLSSLCFVNLTLGLFISVWSLIYGSLMYWFSLRLNQLSFEETESRHALIGQVSDKITNIISLFSFASRSKERERALLHK